MNLNLTIIVIAGLTIIISLLIPEYAHKISFHRRNTRNVKHRNPDLLLLELSRLRKGGEHT